MAQQKKLTHPKPGPNSERIVIDEIFEDGTVRLLRSKRLSGFPNNAFGLETWGEESEDFLYKGPIEAFVGLPTERQLGEGDVFFLADGSKLNKDYIGTKINVTRVDARIIHLLKKVDYSVALSREQIKAEFHKHTTKLIEEDTKERQELLMEIDKRRKKKARG